MRFLVDNCIAPLVSQRLSDLGHNSAHIRSYGMQDSPDRDICAIACAEDRVIITADTDFGTILITNGMPKPSVIQFRGAVDRTPLRMVQQLIQVLEDTEIEALLGQGGIVTIEPGRVRKRSLLEQPTLEAP